MRTMIKLASIAIVFAILAYFFRPQLDHLWAQTKAGLIDFVTKHDHDAVHDHENDEEKYYKLEKREKGAE